MGHFQDEVLTVIRRVNNNWAEGKLRDKIGIFPLLYVEVRPPALPRPHDVPGGEVLPQLFPLLYLEVRPCPSPSSCCTWM